MMCAREAHVSRFFVTQLILDHFQRLKAYSKAKIVSITIMLKFMKRLIKTVLSTMEKKLCIDLC